MWNRKRWVCCYQLTDAGVTINDGSAMITTADVVTSNGVVHIIDIVILPESAEWTKAKLYD
jgi:uncharacterized surface protein with fasciclin (FAS1) repeats